MITFSIKQIIMIVIRNKENYMDLSDIDIYKTDIVLL